MPRTPIAPPDPPAAACSPEPVEGPPPVLYRVLTTLERLDGSGFYYPGAILTAGVELAPESIAILLDRGVIMPHLSDETIASLPELA
jgi:hypothetical protein